MLTMFSYFALNTHKSLGLIYLLSFLNALIGIFSLICIAAFWTLRIIGIGLFYYAKFTIWLIRGTLPNW
jgi:hypothetical protein